MSRIGEQKELREMAKKEGLHCVYYESGTGQGKYKARIGSMTAGFPTVAKLKKWARQYAKAKDRSVTFEKV